MRQALPILLGFLAAGCWSAASTEHGVRRSAVQPIPSPASDTFTPVWAAAVTDSGRQLAVVTNRFVDGESGTFPAESVFVRHFAIRGRSSERDETVVDAGRAAVRVGKTGHLASRFMRWIPWTIAPQPARPASAGVGEVPADADLYRLSSNGKFLLVLELRGRGVNVHGETGSFGVLEYFDVSEARHPRRIGPALEADGPLHNAAVSNDGSRIVLQILEEDGRFKRALALRRKGNRFSPPQRLAAPKRSEGLQFAGNFLFVGMEDPPLSVPTETATTDTIALFDLRTWPDAR